jgi:hypothetical protein
MKVSKTTSRNNKMWQVLTVEASAKDALEAFKDDFGYGSLSGALLAAVKAARAAQQARVEESE